MNPKPVALSRARRALRRFGAIASSAFFVALAAIVLALPATAHAASPPAGTALDNAARASFIYGDGVATAIVSNTVRTIVAPLEALTLTSSQTVARAAGTSVTLIHTLVNTGNVTTSYVLNLTTVAGSAFALANAALVQDLSGNGVADPGEPVLANGATITLAPGASTSLLVTGIVPATAAIGSSTQLTLSAASQVQNARAVNTDNIAVVSGATLVVTKSASPAVPTRGSLLTYALDTRNSGGVAAAGVVVFVDNRAATLVIVRDAIPANTTFASIAAAPSATTLYHHLGDATDHYVTVAPPFAQIDAIAYGADSLPASQSLSGRFSVTVNGNASGVLSNTAYADYADAGARQTRSSNAVESPLPALAPTLTFFGSDTYVRPIQATALGAPLYVQIDGAQCNVDAAALDTHAVTLTSQLTGDTETFNAVETGPNTGVFRIAPNVPTADAKVRVVAVGDGVLEILKNDRIDASISGCGTQKLTTTLLVDPGGVLFDSRSNLPISGAQVQLIDVTGAGNGGIAGGPAKVFLADGVTAAPATVTTGADGSYVFPFVQPSVYRLVISAPPGHKFPSRLTPPQLPQGHAIDARGSYGGTFTVSAGGSAVVIDVPLDSVPVDGLFVEKSASKSIAEIGDFVDYRVMVKNTAGVAFAAVTVHDDLPAGFVYQRGTARLDGKLLADPAGGGGPALDFTVGALASGAQSIVSYRLRLGPAARSGDGTNRAQAASGISRSNLASVKVLLDQGGVFSDRAYLIGKVYADCNANRIQDKDEPGVPDVRIVLEDGTSAVTDEEGKYSLYGLLARTHVAKLDTTTLPDGATLAVLDQRNAGDAGSRFVDLKNGELHRADFAVAQCTPALMAEIATRKSAMTRDSEATSAARALLTATTIVSVDPRTLPAAGVLDAKGIVGRSGLNGTPAGGDLARSRSTRDASVGTSSMAPDAPRAARPSLADLLPTLDAKPGFIDLADNDVLPYAQTAVRVKGPAGAQLKLSVNGVAADASQIGERSTLAESGVAAWEYVGIDLSAGRNRLELTVTDSFGNARDSVTIAVLAPGALAKIVIEAPADAKADGRTPVPVAIRLFDAHDVPVTVRTALTLDATLGQWLATDLDPREPGVQVLVEGGRIDVKLLPPADPGVAQLRVAAGALKSDAKLTFLPDLRPLIAVGVIEGVVNLRNLNPNALVPTQSGDSFEREIRNVSRDFDNGKASAAARGAMYLKGKIDGTTLLTLAYDSDKPQRESLFRDIQPDQFYPVYGDSSVKGFDAQSTSRLYVRVDRGTSYALYGDYTTQTDDPARSLTQYNRALTGAKGRYEAGPLRVEGFAAHTSSRQVIDEIRANGTSGPFALSRAAGLVNSEQVHILTRDRNQPAIVLKDVSLVRFADYEVEAFTGRILFKAPIPSVDADLNPVFIRITYEVDSGGPNFWVGGVDAKLAVTDSIAVGGVYIRDTDPTNRATLRSVNSTIKLAEKAVLVGEFAETESDLFGSGKGRRIEYRQDDERVQARVYGGKTDVNFNNPNALLSQGRAEYGGKVAVRLDERDRAIVEAIRTEDPVTGGKREGVLATVERSFDGNVKLAVGMRHADETLAPAQPTSVGTTPNHFTSVRAKVTVPVPGVPDASVFGEYERAIDAGNRQIAAVGGNYALPTGGKLYARHEFISSLSGAYDLNSTQRLNTTVIGLDSDYMKDGHVFNEYRVGDAIDGRTAETAIGLRNLWRIADGVAVTTTAENIKPMSGPVTDKSTALTGAIDYTADPNWKGSARAEYRNATTSDSWLVTAGAAVKLDANVTLLGKGIVSDLNNNTPQGGARRIARGQLGLAYRPVASNAWNALARVEIKREQDSTLGAASALDEVASIFSAHLNVQASRDVTLSARYGIKRAADRANGIETKSTTQIIGGRAIWDFAKRWDIGANAFMLASNGLRSRQYALGGEAGYLVSDNLWLSVGYNVSGFRDRDLAGEDYTQRGPYLRLRYKFDENLFKTPASPAPRANAGAIP